MVGFLLICLLCVLRMTHTMSSSGPLTSTNKQDLPRTRHPTCILIVPSSSTSAAAGTPKCHATSARIALLATVQCVYKCRVFGSSRGNSRSLQWNVATGELGRVGLSPQIASGMVKCNGETARRSGSKWALWGLAVNGKRSVDR